tara:strand:+ start:642 stop:1253 length:612 start_codon:yes stop_codon:yes gene_type:complete
MSTPLSTRLGQILPRITSPDFLSSEGIGNEIACYVFDYSPEEELQVRDHVDMMLQRLTSHHGYLTVLHLNLFDVALDLLKSRGLYKKLIELQQKKSDAALVQALRGPLAAEKIRDFIEATHSPAQADLFLLSGVGSVWPMLRAHNLLNCLHTVIGNTPLVLFYPGEFDGTTLRLFGKISPPSSQPGTKPYYRAFNLIPRETKV